MTNHSAPFILEILTLVEQHELALQKLYETFAEKLPEQSDFWLQIAAEEAGHAKIARALKDHAKGNFLRMRPGCRLDCVTVRNSIDQLSIYINDVKQHGVSVRRAVAIAKEIETGILERSFEKWLEAEQPEGQELLSRLDSETEGHNVRLDTLVPRRDEYSLLVERKIATAVQVELARTVARKEGLSVASVLTSRFNVPKIAILESMGRNCRCTPYVFHPGRLPKLQAAGKFANLYDVFKARLFVPLEADEARVVVALANPGDLALRDDIQGFAGERVVEYRVAISDDILAAIEALYQNEPQVKGSIRLVLDEMEREKEDGGAEEARESEVSEEDSAIVRLVNLVVEEAHGKGASDIHIEPTFRESVIIRFRIDGVLHNAMSCPGHYRNAIIARIKVMASLDIAERRKPQSGKIPFKRWGRLDIELRVETYPTASGSEDAVLRILAAGKPRPLAQMGFSTRNQEGVARIVQQPYGLFLCVGPTGSGKTTTMHSALGHINHPDLKIMTAEDPVEITQPGLRQVQVNRKAGYTFAEALRSFLRADPDVVMIGEMRDLETAAIAVEASLTGHLVMSTLHTNSAPETVTRLLDMGLDPYSFADALLGVLAQRLMRALCLTCKQLVPDSEAARLLADMQEEYGDGVGDLTVQIAEATLYRAEPAGCVECNEMGYRGRAAVHELMVVDDAIRELIMHRAPVRELREAARTAGMRTLRQDGIEKVLRGVTVMDEVRAVCSR